MRHRLIWIALILSACARGSGTPGAAPDAAPAGAAAIRNQPAQVTYRAAIHRQIEQEYGGQLSVSNVATSYLLRTSVSPHNGGLRVSFTLDSVTVRPAAAFPATEVRAAWGAEFTGLLTPEGRIEQFTAPDATGITAQIGTSLRDFFPHVPPGGVSPGRRWEDSTTTITDAGGVTITVKGRTSYAADGWAEWGGVRGIVVEAVTDYALEGSGATGGQPLTLEGTGRRFVRDYIAPDGLYLGGVTADSSSFNITLTNVGVVVPARQHGADTITVLR